MDKSIKGNVDYLRNRISVACRKVGRDAADVTLLAATKNRSAEMVNEAVSAGVKVFGENRAQELVEKIGRVEGEIDWQFIGHLQRNKVKDVVGFVSLIHSVDSLKLAQEIDKRAGLIGRSQGVLLQVNVAGEESKFGASPSELNVLVENLNMLNNIEVKGLSTVAPLVADPERVRWVFSELRKLGRELEREKENFAGAELSMGMSGDYEVAVEEGSTIVRLGTAIFDTAGR
jgi:pyridoxal phosphate enzyme (YggS family)